MLVRQLMTRDVRTVKASDTVKKAVLLMNRYRIGCVVVVSSDEIIGILTDRDVLKRVVARDKLAGKVLCKAAMSKKLWTVGPDDDADEAARVMVERNIKKLPVIDKDGRLVGIFTAMDILKQSSKIEDEALQKVADVFYVPKDEGGEEEDPDDEEDY